MRKYLLTINLAYGTSYYHLELFEVHGEKTHEKIAEAFDGRSPSINHVDEGASFMYGFITALRHKNEHIRLDVIHSYAKSVNDIEPRFRKLN